jgi:CRISPR-associated protein Csd1
MIEKLIKYAEQQGLSVEPGFMAKDVKWAILCTQQGTFGSVLELGDTESKKNRGMSFPKCPETPRNLMQSGGQSQFLIESAETATLYSVEKKSWGEQEKTRAKHTFFVNLLAEASQRFSDIGVCAAIMSDENESAKIREALLQNKAKPTDKVTFGIIGRQPKFIVEDSRWHVWWREYLSKLLAESKPAAPKRKKPVKTAMRSLADGEIVEPQLSHDPIELKDSLVGGTGQGCRLICFDKQAYESYGLLQSANAAMSRESVAAYRTGINDLLKHSKRIAGTRMVYWYKNAVQRENDPFADIEEPEESRGRAALNAMRKLLEGLRAGKCSPGLGDNRYYAMMLAGNAGRVVICGWMEGEFVRLVENTEKWFDHLRIVNPDGSSIAPPPGLERVIAAQLPKRRKDQDYDKWFAPAASTRNAFWQAAIEGKPIPYKALCRAVVEVRMEILDDKLVDIIRMALMKIYHLRKEKGDSHMQPYLNKDHPHPAYQCGRMMAVLADLQYTALGDVGAGVVQRYYAAASSTPALVLGRLFRMAQNHLTKVANSKGRGLAKWYDDQLSQINGKIDSKDKHAIPSTLTLEEQSLFALGYYQQKAHNAAVRTNKTQEQKEESNE